MTDANAKSISIQALWVRADLFNQGAAKEWALQHGFITDNLRTKTDDANNITHYIFVQYEPDQADIETFRTISDQFPTGISATTAERKSMEPIESKAWSTFEVKGISEDGERMLIKGIASTPETDRDGDVVRSDGARYKLPMPLLNGHSHSDPVGSVDALTVTSRGLEMEASIPKDSGLDYVNRAFLQVKAGLLKGLSIGFRPLTSEPIKTGGRLFKTMEIFEISLVSVPANSGAGITAVKKFDGQQPDLEEQLFNAQAKALDAKNRAAAAIQNAESVLDRCKVR